MKSPRARLAEPSRLRTATLFLCCVFFVLPACRAHPHTVQRAQMLMGTVVRVTAVAPAEDTAQRAAAAGLAEVRRVEERLSTWIPTSDLSRVNAAAGQTPVKVGPDALAVVQRSLEIAELTEGGFNIAVGPAVDAWGVMEEQRIPDPAELARLQPLTDWRQVQVDPRAGTIFLARPGMRLDVGGIGKGYAADLAARAMQQAGATAGVIALSGDLKMFGRMPEGHQFRFGIQHPRQRGALVGELDLENEAISTAGDYERFFERDGLRYHHILDPRTLQPARASQSVTVVAGEGVWADGLDTGIFVMGPEKGMALVERLPGVEAVIVDHEGQIYISSGLRSRIHRHDAMP
ncbi:MAG: FAD:protein FMN transferase [Nitrospirales bacterium]